MENRQQPSAGNCCFCDKNLSPGDDHTTTSNTIIKYKCPGCERIYCSANCCSGHKEKFSCSGVRNSTPYVHLAQFDQRQFLDDYFFLERLNSKIDSAQRILPRLRPKANNQQAHSGASNSNHKKRRFNKRRDNPNRNKANNQPSNEHECRE